MLRVMITGRIINMKSGPQNGRSILSVPPSAEITDERDVAEKHVFSYFVYIQVRVESWVHPLGRPRQLLVRSQQDTASLRFL